MLGFVFRKFYVLEATSWSIFLFTILTAIVSADWSSDPRINIPICTAAGGQNGPRLISDNAGGAIITWEDGLRDICAQRVDAGGRVLWKDDGVPICSLPVWALVDAPQLTSDGAGGAIIAWSDTRSDKDPDIYGLIERKIYAQRVDASGRMLWKNDGVLICTAIGSQSYTQLVSDGAGGAIIAWRDYRSDNADIYAQRVDANGRMLWKNDGVPVCTAVGSQPYTQLVSDGAGGAIIAWYDERSGRKFRWDIYAQRVDASGRMLWENDGVLICRAAESISFPLISDGAGGAIIAWEEQSIYIQRVDANGRMLWKDDGPSRFIVVNGKTLWKNYGICVFTALYATASKPQLASDGEGGVIIAWRDHPDQYPGRSSGDDIYAQRVDASGRMLWNDDGVPISIQAKAQSDCQLISAGVGSGIITWMDYRGNSPWDIYAQNVNADGTLGSGQ